MCVRQACVRAIRTASGYLTVSFFARIASFKTSASPCHSSGVSGASSPAVPCPDVTRDEPNA